MGSAQGLNGNRKEVKKLQCRYGGWVKLIFGKQNEKYSRYDLWVVISYWVNMTQELNWINKY